MKISMKRLAIYDLDDTLLCGDSEFHWAKFTVSKGFIEKEVYLKKIKAFEIEGANPPMQAIKASQKRWESILNEC